MTTKRHTVAQYHRAVYQKLDQIGWSKPSAYLVMAELSGCARRIHRTSEQLCNGFQDWKGNWDQAATERAEKRLERYEAEAAKLAADIGAKAYIQGDPRGWPIYLYWGDVPDIDSRYNSVGIAVPPFA